MAPALYFFGAWLVLEAALAHITGDVLGPAVLGALLMLLVLPLAEIVLDIDEADDPASPVGMTILSSFLLLFGAVAAAFTLPARISALTFDGVIATLLSDESLRVYFYVQLTGIIVMLAWRMYSFAADRIGGRR